MTRPAARAVVEVGIVDKDALAQLRRWGFPLDCAAPEDVVLPPGEATKRIMEAVSSEESVEVRDTDLDIVREYMGQRLAAKLHVPNPEEGKATIGIPVEYCRTTLGEVVIPWTSEAISDILLDPMTYLKPLGQPRLYFVDVRELYYGDHKAFLVCSVTERSAK